ncbi:hypothetical protein HPP92_001421 [Vanilla planifolia]|uniref:Pentatricopeptide repeat-containing protein n=1 Tax=Vanilla planifolia TaxID=51239 RepID=A0A835RQM5_VANPL|nr:hypothetical protein HPP92_001421 [Vanilla planifolia]
MRWATRMTFLLPGGCRRQCQLRKRYFVSSSPSPLACDLCVSDEIVSILETNPDAASIVPPLNSLAPLLSPSSICLAMSSVSSPSSAFHLFAWSSLHRGLRSFSAHNLVISLLLRDSPSSFSCFWSSLSDLQSSSIPVHPNNFAALMSAYNAAGLTENAVEAFTRMPEFASRPNTFTYNTILHILVGKDMVLLAMSIFNQMIKSDCSPNSSTYAILIHGLCKARQIDDALRLFDDMLQRGIVPKTTVYTVLISLLCSTNKVDDAIRHFYLMKEKGCHVDEVVCNALLSGLSQAGRLDEAIKHLKLLQEDGFVLGLNGYSCLIDGLFRTRRFEEACRYYIEMLKNNINPDCILYTIMIKGYANVGRIEKAFDFFNDMTTCGLVPDTYCYNTLIKGLCDAGLLDRARSLKLEISRNGCFPDSATHTILICGLCKEGLVHEAQQIFDEMEKVGCTPTVMTFNSLISGLCKAKKMEEAQRRFCEMEVGVKSYLYLRLSQDPKKIRETSLQRRLQESCEAGDVVQAYKHLRSVMDIEVVPDVITYNILINGMCKSGRIKEALKLVEKMQLEGHLPDAITFGTLVDGLSRAHRDNDILEVLEHMRKSGCKPSVSICNTQMRTLSRRRQISKAVTLWLDYISNGSTNPEETETTRTARKHFEEGCLLKAVRTLLAWERKCGSANSSPYTIWLIGLCQEWRIDEALGIFYLLREFDIDATPPSCALLVNYLCRSGKLGPALDVMLYSLDQGFLFMKPVGNCLIRRLCLYNKLRDAHELVRRMHLAGYDLDVYLRASTKSLLHAHQISEL